MSWLRRKWLTVTVVVAALAAVVVGGVLYTRHSDSTTTPITIMFADASPLIAGNLVRMDGIQVGEISSVALRNGQAAVTVDLDKSALPLHQDASAMIRPVTLLGERFIDLNPGSASAPAMSAPQLIPASRTSAAVDLDQVLDSLNDPTSTALAALVTTLGQGVAGQGQNINSALTALVPAMQNTQQLGQILDQQNSVLSQLVDRASPVAKALASNNGQDLDQAVEYAKQLLSAMSAQKQAMSSAIQQLPATLQQAQHALAQVSGVADAATPVLRSVRPVTDNLTQITSELNSFADSANPALASLPNVLNEAKSLLDQAQPVVRDLGPGGAALPTVSASANQLVGALSPKLTTVLDFMKDWALSTNGRDGLSNYFRAFVVTTPQGLLQIPGVGLGGNAAPTAPSGPSTTPPAGSPPSPSGPLGGIGSLLPPLGGQPSSNGSATGLDPSQENSLLGQLLGGL
ncbi:MAG TPA: MlaD family protein [Pseudonocardiaceae bacterium]|jgi:phospholipid/cholesterol/gamma-HCH transport system substrate-binding protein|nr:MlaD family protein [Pseudonocardiaceae bacterium]